MNYSEDFKIFVATINGEAENCCEISWKVIAHTMRNRIGFANWKLYSNIMQVLVNTGYDAYTQKNDPYKGAKKALDSGDISAKLMNLIKAVEPIFHGIEPDFTGGVVFYYSPKAQAQLHKRDPSNYPSLVPPFVVSKSNPTNQVQIPGTEKDDMRWYKVVTSIFDISFIDSAGNPLVGATVDVIYKDRKPVPLFKDLITDQKGKIKKLKVCNYMGARFKVNGILVKDKNNKEISLLGDGKNYTSFIVVDNGEGGVKSKTDIHNQQSSTSKKQDSIQIDNKDNTEQKVLEDTNKAKQKNVNFRIKVVDSENKAIPNFSYFLKYKGAEKRHSVDSSGTENGLVALSGEEIIVLISGLDSKQEITRFTVKEGMGEIIVKLNLHTFEILFRHINSKKPITNLNLIQKYRDQSKQKKTNEIGKIIVSVMPGFELNYKLRDERNLLTIKGDKNKALRIIDVDSSAIEQASENIKTGAKVPKNSQTNQQFPSELKHKKPIETHDSTPKRDEKVKTSTDGHPKIVVTDSSDIEFTVLTYDKESNRLASNCEYIIEYKGNKNTHISGANGVGKKIHKGQSGQTIKIFESSRLLTQVILQKDMQSISIKVTKSDISKNRVSSVDWCNLFLQSSSLSDLEEPFKTNATKFINGIRKAGITVVINTTWRPNERSYLMYYSTAIARGQVAVDKVPPFPGVNIDWTHKGNKAEAVKAAKAMYQKYGIGNNPVGKPGSSNHNKKMAVDMRIANYVGKIVTIDNEITKITSWATLTQLGKKHNVIWYGNKDAPHWSHTGR